MHVIPYAVWLLSAISPGRVGPDSLDALRVREAYRLTAAVQDSIWPGGWGETPFPLLLVTSDREYLFAFPRVPDGFTASTATDSATATLRIMERPRQFQPTLLATFPAFGPPAVIVMGRPETTGKTSTTWVLTALHERFHQYQTAAPDYFAAVERLDLSGGDQTGMWMLNYAFPYATPAVASAFNALARALARLVPRSTRAQRRAFWNSYEQFLSRLSEQDRRYLGFQLWQEGVARYVELRAAEAAARTYLPTPAFAMLPDFAPFSRAAATMRAELLDELARADLATTQRVSFYAFGAAMALLLDQDAPGWQRRYRTEPFAIERYLRAPR
ncbi:MAG: hypothetical protein MUF00_20360 [Gemmatimonadaceae bacterium]|nr:hypothetical protein [Gemmatimonadaceae bacterium]